MRKLKLQTTDTYGIEIEFVTLNQIKLEGNFSHLKNENKIDFDWVIKREKTCDITNDRKIGLEVNSPIMDDRIKWLQELKIVLEMLQKETEINHQCAIHFHIGKQIFEENVTYLQNLILLWCHYEDILFRYATGEYRMFRKSILDYAKPLNQSLSYRQVMSLHKSQILPVFLTQMISNVSKRNAISLLPYYQSIMYQNELDNTYEKKTVEFRIFASTYQYTLIYSYLECLLQMIDYAKHMSKEIRDCYFESLMKQKDVLEKNQYHIPIEHYLKLQLEKAKEFCDTIFTEEESKKEFMKIYTYKSKSYE